jgi:hypothetical protein
MLFSLLSIFFLGALSAPIRVSKAATLLSTSLLASGASGFLPPSASTPLALVNAPQIPATAPHTLLAAQTRKEQDAFDIFVAPLEGQERQDALYALYAWMESEKNKNDEVAWAASIDSILSTRPTPDEPEEDDDPAVRFKDMRDWLKRRSKRAALDGWASGIGMRKQNQGSRED